ncbi:7-carboxy-7-deazaguanine synthase QueE [Aliidiomarina iranensis]|uniref:7-carboxy-7-deazaguanine synthase n=1 Tax=Aliidiomarina iranensis TaxID=1434071 RepID=A0A432VX45_9GAMM|nr:7-carboxy-7-deazaguanine synthase QueE [Aliidiomarina iranensis]RUO21239.1 7-carboxy-7-deazaguanine synthase QueE [Aliidiomarina iranensis]
MQYPVNELFETIQGEGLYTGVPAIFLRLQGCPVGCPWCDTQHTWSKMAENAVDFGQIITKTGPDERYSELSAEAILQRIQSLGFTAKHIVITGGEPCMYDLRPLAEVLEPLGYQLQIETSGTFPILASSSTWVTVSPKVDMPGGYPVLADAMQRADEIKYPIAMEKHISAFDALLAEKPARAGAVICLQPISQRPRATELAIKVCRERNWRLSVQLHKYLAIE